MRQFATVKDTQGMMFAPQVFGTYLDWYASQNTAPVVSDGQELRLDDNLALFFNRELEHSYREVFANIPTDVTYMEDFNIKSELAYEATSTSYEELQVGGDVMPVSGESSDTSMVTLKGEKINKPVATTGKGYAYTERELNAALLAASKDLSPLKEIGTIVRDAAYMSVQQWLDKTAYYGIPDLGIEGLLTMPNVTLVADATTPYNTSQTAADNYAWFHGLMADIVVNTNGIFRPNKVLTSLSLDFLFGEQAYSGTSDYLKEKISNMLKEYKVALGTRFQLGNAALVRNGVTLTNADNEVLLWYNLSKNTFIRYQSPIIAVPLERRPISNNSINYQFIGGFKVAISSLTNAYPASANLIEYSTATS